MQCEENAKHKVLKKTGKVAIDGGVNYTRYICRECSWRSPMITDNGPMNLPKIEKE